jgi:hypothetical protein
MHPYCCAIDPAAAAAAAPPSWPIILDEARWGWLFSNSNMPMLYHIINRLHLSFFLDHISVNYYYGPARPY